MQNKARPTNQDRSQGKGSNLVTPQMRQQTRELKRGLDQCGHPLFSHLGSLTTIFEALNTAQQAAECLLTDDPFAAWQKLSEEEERDEFCDTTGEQQDRRTAAPSVERMITRPMRQQLVEATKRLDEYHRCLTTFINDLTKLKSFQSVTGCAEDLECD